jgi:hypothetical protein
MVSHPLTNTYAGRQFQQPGRLTMIVQNNLRRSQGKLVSRFYDKAKINNNNSRQTKLTEFGFEVVALSQSQKKITEFFPKEEAG